MVVMVGFYNAETDHYSYWSVSIRQKPSITPILGFYKAETDHLLQMIDFCKEEANHYP